uniref:Ig-like domain-containing protein n=1 Tax=Gouania willdenowi TaxID=441366 RepID=A0A8C5GPQ7_GOUWI
MSHGCLVTGCWVASLHSVAPLEGSTVLYPLLYVQPLYVILTQGQTATLKCTFTTISSTPYLFWYKQEVNSYPKFILRRSRSSADNSPEFVKDRFDAELKDSSVPLMIQDLHVCDSAVYYCINNSLSS